MIKLTKDEEVFHLTLDNGENRWNTNLVREISSVIDEIEASKGPAALVTSSSDPKFFSNGLDLDWIKSAPSNDRSAFTTEFMTLMGRIISLICTLYLRHQWACFRCGLYAGTYSRCEIHAKRSRLYVC